MVIHVKKHRQCRTAKRPVYTHIFVPLFPRKQVRQIFTKEEITFQGENDKLECRIQRFYDKGYRELMCSRQGFNPKHFQEDDSVIIYYNVDYSGKLVERGGVVISTSGFSYHFGACLLIRLFDTYPYTDKTGVRSFLYRRIKRVLKKNIS
jgi:hypothetical protein